MKIYTHRAYGKPEEVITLQEVVKPQPVADQVLLKVKAAPVNDYDWCVVRGKPFAYRLFFGLFRPKKRFQKLGMEIAGVVEALGPDAGQFEVGEAVYGDTSDHAFGSLGEYLCVSEKALIRKPNAMSFEAAAAIPHAAMLAYEGLVDLGDIQDGQKILVNGAGGGMGTFAVQIAKQYNAEVTGVDSGDKFEMLRAQGFDHLIDYQQEDFTRRTEKYDLILDARTGRSPFNIQRALKPGGKYVSVGGKTGRLLQMALLKGLIRLFTGKRFQMLALKPNQHLDQINQWYEAGMIKPVIDGPHPFDQVPQLIQYFGEARHKGKVVIAMDEG